MWRKQLKQIVLLFGIFLLLYSVYVLTDVPKYEPKLFIPKNFTEVKSMTADQWISFLQYKERQYKNRRLRLKAFCKTIDKNDPLRPFLMHPNPNAMIYDKRHGLAYCQIPKVQ